MRDAASWAAATASASGMAIVSSAIERQPACGMSSRERLPLDQLHRQER